MTPLDFIVTAGLVALVVMAWAHFRIKRMWRRENVMMAAGFVAAFAAICVLVVQGYLYFDGNACEAKAEGMGREYRFDLWSECMVRTDDGQFVPLDTLRVNEQGEVVR